MDDASLSDLIARRAKLTAQISRSRASVKWLDAAIQDMWAKGTRGRARPKRGHVLRAMLTILRKSPAPLDSLELTALVIIAIGRDCRDPVRYQRMVCQVRATLSQQKANGTVASGGPRRALVWWIAG